MSWNLSKYIICSIRLLFHTPSACPPGKEPQFRHLCGNGCINGGSDKNFCAGMSLHILYWALGQFSMAIHRRTQLALLKVDLRARSTDSWWEDSFPLSLCNQTASDPVSLPQKSLLVISSRFPYNRQQKERVGSLTSILDTHCEYMELDGITLEFVLNYVNPSRTDGINKMAIR